MLTIDCRFSHGEVVYVSELREFLEFDLSKLEEGSSCLARHEDGIWYPAKIKGIIESFLSCILQCIHQINRLGDDFITVAQ